VLVLAAAAAEATADAAPVVDARVATFRSAFVVTACALPAMFAALADGAAATESSPAQSADTATS